MFTPAAGTYQPRLPLKYKGEAEESCLLPFGTGHRITVSPTRVQGEQGYLVSLHSPRLTDGLLGLLGRGVILRDSRPLFEEHPPLAQLVDTLALHLLETYAPEVKPRAF